MLKQIRHIQKGTLIVVTAIIVVAFAFFYSSYDPKGGNANQHFCLIKVGNRCYRQKEVQKLVSHFSVARDLMMYDFAMPMLTGDDGQGDPLNFALNLIVLRKEAAKLGINPGIEEIEKEIPKLNIFMRPNVSADFLQNRILGPNGFTNADLSQLVKDYLSYKQLQELIGSGVQAVPSEVERERISAKTRESTPSPSILIAKTTLKRSKSLRKKSKPTTRKTRPKSSRTRRTIFFQRKSVDLIT